MRIDPPAGLLFPLQRETIWYFISLGFLAFVATIALGATLDSRGNLAGAQNHPFGRVTVQIMPVGAAPPAAEIPAALKVLNATPGIASAAVLSDAENSALVAPWLGANLSPRDLPFPVLIDVKLAPGAGPNLPGLQKKLTAAAPHAVVETPRQNTGGIIGSSAQSIWIALLLLGAIAIAFTLSFACLIRSQMAIHRETAELLHLMGAQGTRVAALLTTGPVVVALIASLIGTAVAAGLFSLPEISEGYGIRVNIPVPGLSVMGSACLVLVPATAALIAWLTARSLVMPALRRF